LFTNKSLIENILELINISINDFYESNEIDSSVYKKFDELILKNSEVK
jgi:hypothetical protein